MIASGGPAPARLPRSRPRVADVGRARWRLADLEASLPADLAARLRDRHVRAVAAAVADHSPDLWRLVERDARRALDVFDGNAPARLDAILADLRVARGEDEADLMARLRRARDDVTVLAGLAELGGLFTQEQAMAAQSRAAEAFVATAFDFLRRRHGVVGAVRLDAADPRSGCGVVVLALGDLGGSEMDYSGEIDLFVLYDDSSPEPAGLDAAAVAISRLARDLQRLLQQPTADGVALRVDLRLRPAPGAKAVAIGVDAALRYYETFGQNWERAALVKARVVAGDAALGARFLAALSPFLWRRYFDFAAIADTLSIKRQVGEAGAALGAAGHDVRLGRGGLRDIALFVQTQQLVYGGRRPSLRGARTVPMLRRLRREGWIDADAADALATAHAFLSRTLRRLQIAAGPRGDKLPETSEALGRFARFCGFAAAERFAAVYVAHLDAVVRHCGLLFETAPGLGSESGSLVFTGVDDDPATLQTLSKLGFRAPDVVAATVRAWHSGLRPAVRSVRAREQLTDLVPKLLQTFAEASDPDAAIAGFDRALDRLPAASELFAILAAKASIRALFADILGSAPVLADEVARHPHLLDVAINPALGVCLDEDAMEARVEAALQHAVAIEDVLDAARDFRREEHFLIAVRLLSGDLAAHEAGRAYSACAVALIRSLLRQARAAFAAEHGEMAGAVMTVLAMGDLGSGDMGARSDLDLVVIYDFDAAHLMSNGPKPLDASAYFSRLTQRIVSYLTVPTRRGRLYEVDMRLRPSGRQGPLATKFSAFAAYQRTSAETWEHLALARARPVAGDESLCRRVDGDIAAILAGSRHRRSLANEVRALQAGAEDANDAGVWDLDRVPGGLGDLDAVVRVLLLRDATRPAGLGPSADALAGLDAPTAEQLAAGWALMAATWHLVRLALPDGLTPETAGRGFRRRLVEATGAGSFATLKRRLAAARRDVEMAFDRLPTTG